MNFIKTTMIILLVTSIMSCNAFAGILFPKIQFSLSPVGEQPPSSAAARLDAGSEYQQTFTFFFSQALNSFKAYFIPTIFVNKPYKFLHIREFIYEWDNNTGVFFENRVFGLPLNSYVSKNDWYWVNGVGDFFNINFEKLFKGKKPGDKFLFRIMLRYSFDDDPEQTQVLEYNVTALKGKYVSPFMGI